MASGTLEGQREICTHNYFQTTEYKTHTVAHTDSLCQLKLKPPHAHTHCTVAYLRSHRVLYPNHSDAGQLRHYFCLVLPVRLRIAQQVTVRNANGPQPLTSHRFNHLQINRNCSSGQKTGPRNLPHLFHSSYTRMPFTFQYVTGLNCPYTV